MSESRSWIFTRSGAKFDVLDPKVEDVHLSDIVWSLSRVCRFNGHTRRFYSVAQHSLHTAELIYEWTGDRSLALSALLHDAAEAYTGDIARPIKRMFEDRFPGSFEELELGVELAIMARFNVSGPLDSSWSTIKQADDVMVATEIRDLMNTPASGSWSEDLEQPLERTITPMDAAEVRRKFTHTFMTWWVNDDRRLVDILC
jgi:hypothetical protein